MSPSSQSDADAFVGDIIQRIQNTVFCKRIRIRDSFKDFDRGSTGCCVETQFHKAMKNLRLDLTQIEIEALLEHFTLHQCPRPNVSHKHFCDCVDEVFNPYTTDLHQSIGASREMGNFRPKPVDDMDRLYHVLHRVAVLCKTQGYVLSSLFIPFVTAPGTVNPLGQVTVNQFRRNFPFRKELGEEGIDLLIQRYGTDYVDGHPIRIHFQALHTDVSESASELDRGIVPKGRGPGPENAQWTNDELSVLQRITARVVERRLRLEDFFRDYDKLRKRTCSKNVVRTIFGLLNITADMRPGDYEQLERLYVNEQGEFRYADFCADVNASFGKPNLQKFPLEVVKMVDASTTACARWNQLKSPPEDAMHIDRLVEQIRTVVMAQRIQLRPYFLDVDKYHKGIVQRPSFKRVLASNGIKLSDGELELLADGYCNRGILAEIDYNVFLKAVDPPTDDEKVARRQMDSPYRKPTNDSFKYFDAHGKIIPLRNVLVTQSPMQGTAGGSRPSSAASSRSQSSLLPREPAKVRPKTASGFIGSNKLDSSMDSQMKTSVLLADGPLFEDERFVRGPGDVSPQQLERANSRLQVSPQQHGAAMMRSRSASALQMDAGCVPASPLLKMSGTTSRPQSAASSCRSQGSLRKGSASKLSRPSSAGSLCRSEQQLLQIRVAAAAASKQATQLRPMSAPQKARGFTKPAAF